MRSALLLALSALALAACGADEKTAGTTPPVAAATAVETPTPAQTAQAKVAGKDCSEAGDLSAEPERRPPDDVAVPGYVHVYRSDGTKRFYAVLDGTPDDLASRRDDAQNELVQNSGYSSLSTDQEEGSEAEAHLKGAEHTVDIQVAPLCDGKIRIRYTVQ